MRVLLIGDGVVSTGFSKMNHAYLDGLRTRGHEVFMLALNYDGDPHPYRYPIYPCNRGGDAFGVGRVKELVGRTRPDVVCLTQDPWNVQVYLDEIDPGVGKVVSVAVDGKNCRADQLKDADHCVFWTRFGQNEAFLGGYNGDSSVIPLGVDRAKFYPVPKEEVRSVLPSSMKGAFIVGVVGRNQPRKRIDLAMMYFAEWIKSRDRKDAYLFLHVAPTGENAYDIYQLSQYLGITDRLISPARPINVGFGVSEDALRRTYCLMDVMLTCTQGEGWGLCHMEAMACGVPSIVPAWSALGEWTEDAAIQVGCTGRACTLNGINVVGGIMDQEEAIVALEGAYVTRDWEDSVIAKHSEKGLSLVARPEYSWENVGARFAEVVESVHAKRTTGA
jgi:D-inositol-3-phosphate glycosyltransferase